ncbi:MAG: DUF72 domain-containing protein [Oligoflexia bacterium]|nr:DUF72 domain-containing protein [Oligoflexia bacterium]
MSDIRIGISGWNYAPWRGVFFPKNLPQDRELEYASRQFRTIEINGSFYSLQAPASYMKWYSSTPGDFIFAVKANRYITHVQRLKEAARPIANFFASGILALKEKLGPILWQFPPNMRFDPERFEAFVRLLPQDTQAAARMAENRDPWMRGRSLVETDRKRSLRHAIEVRHESFRNPRFSRLLKRHKIAWVVSHSSNAWPYFEEVTADFVYVRLHGEGALYSGGYGSRALDRWAKKARDWAAGKCGRDVFVYFDNDAKVRAPFDAQLLEKRLEAEGRLAA